MKKINLGILLIICLFTTGCFNDVNSEINNNSDKIKKIDDLTKKKGTLLCTRSASATNAEPFFSYVIDYKNDEILKIHSTEGITSNDSSVLDEYEDAYKKIANYYVDIKYYDTKVERQTNKVTWDTTINYQKIDLDKLLELEGEENNIIEDGKAKLSSWLELGEKVGTTCVEK